MCACGRSAATTYWASSPISSSVCNPHYGSVCGQEWFKASCAILFYWACTEIASTTTILLQPTSLIYWAWTAQLFSPYISLCSHARVQCNIKTDKVLHLSRVPTLNILLGFSLLPPALHFPLLGFQITPLLGSRELFIHASSLASCVHPRVVRIYVFPFSHC